MWNNDDQRADSPQIIATSALSSEQERGKRSCVKRALACSTFDDGGGSKNTIRDQGSTALKRTAFTIYTACTINMYAYILGCPTLHLFLN